MQEEPSFPSTLPFGTPPSTNSAELGRLRKKPKTPSYLSDGEETFASRIMVAQRHYSAVATTVIVLTSPVRQEEPADDDASIVVLEHDDTARTSTFARIQFLLLLARQLRQRSLVRHLLARFLPIFATSSSFSSSSSTRSHIHLASPLVLSLTTMSMKSMRLLLASSRFWSLALR